MDTLPAEMQMAFTTEAIMKSRGSFSSNYELQDQEPHEFDD